MSLKLDSNVINSYYNKTYIDSLFETTYTQTQIDSFVDAKMSIADTYHKTVIDSMFVLKLNIADYITASSLKADTNSVYLKTLLYTKTETDTLLNNKINLNTVYTIAQENTLLANKLDITTFNTSIALKANTADFYGKASLYTKTETDTLLNNKLNSSLITSYYTKTEITNIFINYYTKLYR